MRRQMLPRLQALPKKAADESVAANIAAIENMQADVASKQTASAASEKAAAASAAAAGSAAQAETLKTAAAKSASDAQGYMQAASGAATAANASAENAAGSKAAAASSATASADSATAASAKATEAADSASAAAASEQAAAQAAEIAQDAAESLQPDIEKLKGDLTRLNNTGEESVAAGKVWTTNAAGAGWADPQGGGDKPWLLIRTVTIPEDPTMDTSGIVWHLSSDAVTKFGFNTDEIGSPFSYKELLIVSENSADMFVTAPSSKNFNVYLNWYNASYFHWAANINLYRLFTSGNIRNLYVRPLPDISAYEGFTTTASGQLAYEKKATPVKYPNILPTPFTSIAVDFDGGLLVPGTKFDFYMR